MFKKIKRNKIRKTAFNLSHERKQTMDLGKLTPVLLEECLPGDKFEINSNIMVKLAPLIAPIMHRVDVYQHFFFVPNRILLEQGKWEGIITGETEDTIPTYMIPEVDAQSLHTLSDYFGIPYHSSYRDRIEVSRLPWLAYWKIWNEYYRDQNLEEEFDANAEWDSTFNVPKYRAWEKDYFTSALPWAQKGGNVELPFTIQPDYYDTSIAKVSSTGQNAANETHFTTNAIGQLKDDSGSIALRLENLNEMEGAIDINEFRTAHHLQRWLERNARGGSRYVEHLLSHWNVKSRDASLQRPEFLGGGKVPIVVSEVLQTSSTDEVTPQGNPTGHGIGVGDTRFIKKYCEEHGWIMAIMSIVPKPAYYQGLHRKFSRKINLDFAYPEFANLGEQEVLNKEIFCDGAAEGEETFGYQSRYAEYKYVQDSVHGDFKLNLEFFHLGRKFANLPGLNETFINMAAEAPLLEERVFAAGRDAHPFWVQMYHNIKAVRALPYYGTPTI